MFPNADAVGVPLDIQTVMRDVGEFLSRVDPPIAVAVLLLDDPQNPGETLSLTLRFASNIDPRAVAVCLRDLADVEQAKP